MAIADYPNIEGTEVNAGRTKNMETFKVQLKATVRE